MSSCAPSRTQSVPFTGKALGDLQRGASYHGGQGPGSSGVEFLGLVESYGPRASLSPEVLGVEDKVVAAKSDPQAAAPALPLEAVEPKPLLSSSRQRPLKP